MEEDLKTRTEQEAKILYNTRSEEAQEVIGRMPHWIIRWGITVMGGFVLLLFIIAATVKYPETVKSEVTLSLLNPPTIYSAKSDGIIKKILIKDSQIVNTDQLLAIIALDSSGEEYEIKSNKNGIAIFFSDIKEEMHLEKKEPIMAITSIVSNPNSYRATALIHVNDRRKINIGQTVQVELYTYPSQIYGTLKGTIYKISPFATSDRYIITILFENGLVTTSNRSIQMNDALKGFGSIIVKDKTVLTRLFDRVKTLTYPKSLKLTSNVRYSRGTCNGLP